MRNLQARMKHRTIAQVTELRIQSAEDYHQQYLYKGAHRLRPRPGPDRSTGASCPVAILPA